MAQTPIINTQLDDISAKLDALNHLEAHRNAALDLIAADKKATIASDIGLIVTLIQAGEYHEEMDYGDQIALPWTDTNGAEYTPEMDFCHLEDGELEDGEIIPTAVHEWHWTTPAGMPFDASEAIIEPEGAALPAGTYHFLVANDSWGGNNGKYIQFTLPQELPVGAQIRKSAAYNALITSGTLDVYADGASHEKLYSMTPTEGQGGTFLGTSDGSGDVNHWHRVALGYNRWAKSALRQQLNSVAKKGEWWTSQNRWDVAPVQADTVDGFLSGYAADVIEHFRPCKVVTQVNNIDGGGTDITYDRVFIKSLEQAYIVPQAPAGVEGAYWEYYKRLLGRTEPAQRQQTYARLIKYAINAKTTAQSVFSRSAKLGNANGVWYVAYTSGYVNSGDAYSAYRCAPAVRIG